jgi:hypothetical protein
LPRGGLPGIVGSKIGVLLPSGGEELNDDAPLIGGISGERLFGSRAGSPDLFGMGIGSDIPEMVLRCVWGDSWMDTLRKNAAPLSTNTSAMAGVQ